MTGDTVIFSDKNNHWKSFILFVDNFGWAYGINNPNDDGTKFYVTRSGSDVSMCRMVLTEKRVYSYRKNKAYSWSSRLFEYMWKINGKNKVEPEIIEKWA